MTKKEQLYNLFEVVIGILKDNERTIVMDNQGNTRGQIYTISKATHEQAAVGRSESFMFSGTAPEVIIYLTGFKDYYGLF